MVTFTAICLDVGPSMRMRKGDGSASYFDMAAQIICHLVHKKLVEAKKSSDIEIALILLGTKDKASNISADGYDHITTLFPMEQGCADLVRFVSDKQAKGGIKISEIPNCSTGCDVIDAIVVAMDEMQRKIDAREFKGKAKSSLQREIILLSDLVRLSCRGVEDLPSIIGGLNECGYVVKSIGCPDVDIEAESQMETDASDTAVAVVQKFCRETDGRLMSFEDAHRVITEFSIAEPSAAKVFQGPLEIGSLQIFVHGYNRQQQAKPRSFAKCAPPAAEGKDHSSSSVSTKTEYTDPEEDGAEVGKDDVIKAYCYGKERVPWPSDNKELTKLETERCLRLLCFVPAHSIKQHMYLGAKVLSFHARTGDDHARTALAALCTAMNDENVHMIARFCARKNAEPKLLVLWAHVKPEYEALLGAQIPFKEDFQNVTLPDSTNGIDISDAQQEAMDAYVDQLDLMSAYKDDTGDPMEALQPKMTFDPIEQRLRQVILHRVLHPGCAHNAVPLPPLDAGQRRHVHPHEHLWEGVDADPLRQLFPLVAIDKASEKKDATAKKDESNDNADTALIAGQDSHSTKRRRVDADDAADKSVSAIIRGPIKAIGNGNPVADYIDMANNQEEDLLEEATDQLQSLVQSIVIGVASASKGTHTELVLSCMQAMRKVCLENLEPALFNRNLLAVRDLLKGKAAVKTFYDTFVTEKIHLISKDECDASDVDADSAEIFVPMQTALVDSAACASIVIDDDDTDLVDDL
eukprot:m.1109848 g.1109848  ORF g.1109848 m.1109848 type:complete len:750 (+) comp24355_c0_seq7:88-2337(+)